MSTKQLDVNNLVDQTLSMAQDEKQKIDQMEQELGVKIPLNPAQYQYIANKLFDMAPEEREAEKVKLTTALEYSRRFDGLDMAYAYDHLEDISQVYLGQPFKANPTCQQALRNSWRVGDLSQQRAAVANQYMYADLADERDEAKIAEIEGQMKAIDEEIYNLKDYIPKNILQKFLNSAVEQIPYMTDTYLHGLAGGAAAGLTVAGIAKATGVGASIGSVAGPGGTVLGAAGGAMIGSAVAIATAFFKGKRTEEIVRGNAYYDMKQKGVDSSVARDMSFLSGVLSAAIEGVGGFTFAEHTKLLGIPLPKIDLIPAQLEARMLSKGALGELGMWATNLIVDATSEGFEEYVEAWKDEGMEALAQVLSGVDPTFDLKETHRQAFEEFFAAFGASLILGAVPTGINTVNDARTMQALRSDAVLMDSRAALRKKYKDATPEGMSESAWNSVIDKTFDQYAEQRSQVDRTRGLASLHTVGIDENVDYYTEEGGFLKEAEDVEYEEPKREPDGSLHMEISKKYHVSSNGTDQHKAIAMSPDGKSVYGEIIFNTHDNSSKVEIEEVRIAPAYDLPGFKREMVDSFNDYYMGGADLTWNTKTDSDRSVMEDIGSFAPADGFNRFDLQETMKLQKDVFSPSKTYSNPRAAAVYAAMTATATQAMGAPEGLTGVEWTHKHIQPVSTMDENGKVSSRQFGTAEDFKARHGIELQGRGAMESLGDGVRAIIYAGHTADPTTYTHETGHVLLLSPERRAKFTDIFNRLKNKASFRQLVEQNMVSDENRNGIIHHGDIDNYFKDGEWGENEDEFTIEMLELFHALGADVMGPELKRQFKELDLWFNRIYNVQAKAGLMDKELVDFFSSLYGTPAQLREQRQKAPKVQRQENTQQEQEKRSEGQEQGKEAKPEPEQKKEERKPRTFEEVMADDKNVTMEKLDGTLASIYRAPDGKWRIRYYETDNSVRSPKKGYTKAEAMKALKAEGYDLTEGTKNYRLQQAMDDMAYAEAMQQQSDSLTSQMEAWQALKDTAERNGYIDRNFTLDRYPLEEKDEDGDLMLPSDRFPLRQIGPIEQMESLDEVAGDSIIPSSDPATPNVETVRYQANADYNPKSTSIGYKLFEMDTKTGQLYPLFINTKYVKDKATGEERVAKRYIKENKKGGKILREATEDESNYPYLYNIEKNAIYVDKETGEERQPTKKELGDYQHTDPETRKTLPYTIRTEKGKYSLTWEKKAYEHFTDQGVWFMAENPGKMPTFAYRPGWHIGSSLPDAPWLKSFDPGAPNGVYQSQRNKNRYKRVWAEVSYPTDIDYNKLLAEQGRTEMEEIPEGGYYLFRESNGVWVIAGAIKINRILSDADRQAIFEANGYNEQEAWENAPSYEQRKKQYYNGAGEVRYQSEAGDTVVQTVNDSLILTHNLDASRISDIQSIGGMPMPSLAITTKALQHTLDGFGDVTLLGGNALAKSLIQSGDVYERDVWSPTVPHPEYAVTESETEDFIRNLNAGLGKEREVTIYPYLDSHVYKDKDRFLEHLLSKDALYFAYANKKGEYEGPIYKEVYVSEAKDASPAVQNAIKVLKENPEAKPEDIFEAIKENIQKEKDFVRWKWSKDKANFIPYEPSLEKDHGRVYTATQEAKRIIAAEQGAPAKKVIDSVAMKQKYVNGKEAEVKAWIQPQVDELFGDKMISVDDYLEPYNAENILAAMQEETQTGTGGFLGAGVKQIRAKLSELITSIEEAHEYAATKLGENNVEKYEALSDYLYSLIDANAKVGEYESGAQTFFDALEMFLDEGEELFTPENIKAFMKEETSAFKEAPSSFFEKAVEIFEALNEMPRPYFEAKPQSVMQFSDFSAAFVPESIEQKSLEALQDAGLDIVFYEGEDRQQKLDEYVAEHENVRFQSSLTPEEAEIIKQAQEEGIYMTTGNGQPSKLTAAQWLSVRTAAFKRWAGDWENNPEEATKVLDVNGEPMPVYHGTKMKGLSEFEYDPERQTGADYGEAYYFTTNKKNADGYSRNPEKNKELERYSQEKQKVIKQFLQEQDPEKKQELKDSLLDFRLDGKSFDDILHSRQFDTDGETLTLFLNMRNPLEVDAAGAWYYDVYDDYFKQAREDMNDGIIIHNVDDSSSSDVGLSDVYIVFSPHQIKSATDNSGDYDGRNANILYQDLNIEANLEGMAAYATSFEEFLQLVEGKYLDIADLGEVKDMVRAVWSEEKGQEAPDYYHRITSDELNEENMDQFLRENPWYMDDEPLPPDAMYDEEYEDGTENPDVSPEEVSELFNLRNEVEEVEQVEEPEYGDTDSDILIKAYERVEASASGKLYTLAAPNTSLELESQKQAQYERILRSPAGTKELFDLLRILGMYGDRDYYGSAEIREDFYLMCMEMYQLNNEQIQAWHDQLAYVHERMENGIYGDYLKNAMNHYASNENRAKQLTDAYRKSVVSYMINASDPGREFLSDATGQTYWLKPEQEQELAFMHEAYDKRKAQWDEDHKKDWFKYDEDDTPKAWSELGYADKRIQGAAAVSPDVRHAIVTGSEKFSNGQIEATFAGLQFGIDKLTQELKANNKAGQELKKKYDTLKLTNRENELDASSGYRLAGKAQTIDKHLLELSKELHQKAVDLGIENPLAAINDANSEWKWDENVDKNAPLSKAHYVQDQIEKHAKHVKKQAEQIQHAEQKAKADKKIKDTATIERWKAAKKAYEKAQKYDEDIKELKRQFKKDLEAQKEKDAGKLYDAVTLERWKAAKNENELRDSYEGKLDQKQYEKELAVSEQREKDRDREARHLEEQKERDAHNLKQVKLNNMFKTYDTVTEERWKAQKKLEATKDRYEEKLDFAGQQRRIDLKHQREDINARNDKQRSLERWLTAKRMNELRKRNDEAIKELKELYKKRELMRKAREYKKDLAKRLMKKPSANVYQDQADMIREIQAAINPAFSKIIRVPIEQADGSIEKQSFLITDLRELAKKLPDSPIFSLLKAEQLEKLEKQNLNDLTIGELEDLVSMVEELRRLGLQKRQEIMEQVQGDIRYYRKKILAQLEAKAGDSLSPNLAGSLESKRMKNEDHKAMNIYGATINMHRKAMILDGNKEGGLFDYLLTEMKREHQDRTFTAVRDKLKPLEDFMKEKKVSPEDFAEQVTVQMPGLTGTYSIDDLFFIYYSNRNEQNHDAIAYGNLVSMTEKKDIHNEMMEAYADNPMRTSFENERVREIGDERYDALLSKAQDIIRERPELAEVAEAFAEAFQDDSLFQQNAEVMKKLYNRKVEKVDFYLPNMRIGLVGEEPGVQMRADLLNVWEGQGAHVDVGHTHGRIEISPMNQSAIQLGLVRGYEQSIYTQAHTAENLEYVNMLKGIFMSRNKESQAIMELIEQLYGSGMRDSIETHIKEIANPQSFEKQESKNKVVRALRGNLYASYLGFKASGIILQGITSPAPFLAKVGPLRLVHSYMQMMFHPIDVWNEVTDKSAFMANRSYDYIAGKIKADMSDMDKKKWERNWAKFLNFGLNGLELIDRFAVAGGWMALYKKNIEEGMSEEMAIKKADQFVRDTQPQGDITEMSPLFKNKDAAWAAMLQFQTSLNVIWQNCTYDVPQMFRHGKWLEALGMITGYGMAGTLLFLIQDGFEDDDDTKDKLKKLAYGWTTQFTSGIPLISQLFDDFFSHVLTGERGMRYSSPMFPALEKGFNAAHYAIEGNWEKAGKNFLDSALLFTGGPYSLKNELLQVPKVGLGAFVGRRDYSNKKKK